MTNEQFLKIKACKTPEELMALAKENGLELTLAEAEEKYASLHNEGELADDELDAAAGGGCNKNDGRLIVTLPNSCDHYVCESCGGTKRYDWTGSVLLEGGCTCSRSHIKTDRCSTCKYMSYEKGLWLCNNPKNMG